MTVTLNINGNSSSISTIYNTLQVRLGLILGIQFQS